MIRRLFVLTAAGLIVACSSPSGPSVPDGDPTIVGPIVATGVSTPTAGDRWTVHVKTDLQDECGIIFAVDDATDIVRRDGDGDLVGADADDLDVGDTVRVWARGGIAESCPAQGVAAAIEIVAS